MKIVIEEMRDGFKAYEKGKSGTWEHGRSRMEALGKLIFTIRGELGLEVC